MLVVLISVVHDGSQGVTLICCALITDWIFERNQTSVIIANRPLRCWQLRKTNWNQTAFVLKSRLFCLFLWNLKGWTNEYSSMCISSADLARGKGVGLHHPPLCLPVPRRVRAAKEHAQKPIQMSQIFWRKSMRCSKKRETYCKGTCCANEMKGARAVRSSAWDGPSGTQDRPPLLPLRSWLIASH